jgi:hypothetical protein
MVFEELFQRFAQQAPVTVMLRAVMENSYSAAAVDQLFAETARRQRPGELLFSTVVDLLGLVVCGARKSVNSAYTQAKDRVNVSVNSLYNKLDGVEIEVSRELVRRTAGELRSVMQAFGVPSTHPFRGYRRKVLDGNHLPATEHRLAELRLTRQGPLPGHALCVLEPDLSMITDVFPCEDGHAQERSLLPQVLETAAAKDLWIADRNFCTTGFVFGLATRKACWIVRQHASTLSYELLKRRRLAGGCETGVLYEQAMRLTDPQGRTLTVRRVTVVLNQPTEAGDREIHLLTNLPKKFTAAQIAEGYLTRWRIENAFQEMEQSLHSEISTLGYPKAALLAFCLAVVTYNLLSVVKAAIAKVHGSALPRERISGYYLAADVSFSYGGMSIAIPPREWTRRYARLTPRQLARQLEQLASHVRPEQFRKHVRGPKKPRPQRISGRRNHHVSTARLLAQRPNKTFKTC